jgi:hypothetical protein
VKPVDDLGEERALGSVRCVKDRSGAAVGILLLRMLERILVGGERRNVPAALAPDMAVRSILWAGCAEHASGGFV